MILDTRELVKRRVEELKKKTDKMERKPKLVIIRVGNDPASARYVANKVKQCELAGIESEIKHFTEMVEQSEVKHLIKNLNKNYWVDAILLQLPLPKHLDEDYLTNIITPEKDVDGFCATNAGKLMLGQDTNVACTPAGIMTILEENDIKVKGKDVVIINRSNIVGKPLAMLFLQKDATVTICHSKTKELLRKIRQADIVVTAIGKANYFEYSDFKEGATILDVSINFNEEGKMCGDVKKSDYDTLVKRGCNITPVPFGVGQTTVLSLLEQTLKIKERRDENGN